MSILIIVLTVFVSAMIGGAVCFFGGCLNLLLGIPAGFGAQWMVIDLMGLNQITFGPGATGWEIPMLFLVCLIATAWGLASALIGLSYLSLLPPPLGTALPDNY